MKKMAVCLAVLFSFFSLFADDIPLRNPPNPKPINFHGRRMMRKEDDFFVRQIASRLVDENDKKGIEIIFIFSVPFDLRSINKDEIFINENSCSENVVIRFNKFGNALRFFIPNEEADLPDDISVALGEIKSYNGTAITESNFEKIEIGKSVRFSKMNPNDDFCLPPPPSEFIPKNRAHHEGD